MLLALALGLVVVLVAGGSWALWSSMARHRMTADETLTDHSSYILGRYSNSIQMETWFAVRTLFATVQQAAAGTVAVQGVDSLAALAQRDALGPDVPPLAPSQVFAGTTGQWRSLTPATLDAPLKAALDRRLRDSLPSGWSFYGALITRPGGDTSIAFFEPRHGGDGVVGIDVPLHDFRDKILLPPITSLTRSFRYLEDSLYQGTVHDSLAPFSVRITVDDATLLGYGAFSNTQWHATRPVLVWFGGSATLWIEPQSVQLLMPGGYPPRPGPRVLAAAILALLLVAGVAVLGWRTVALARQREEFTSSVSHELRTPLTNIQLFAETLLMERARTTEERRTALETITRETRRLVHMVENVLAFSRIGRPSETLVRRPERTSRLVEDAVTSFGPLFRAHGITPEISVTGPAVASVDGDAVRRILVNLLDNAVRYGPEGQRIDVTVVNDRAALHVTVEDEGPGVSPEDRERIWRPFERGAANSDGGTGIGLAVVAQLVALHGGEARVETGERGGARFVVRLPFPDPNEEGAA